MKTLSIAVGCLVAANVVLAQTAPEKPPPAAIGGAVTEAVTGRPIADATVTAEFGDKRPSARTDSQGRYTLRNLDPGRYTIRAAAGKFVETSRVLTLNPGVELGKVDFEMTAPATISGIVLDENKEPLSDITITRIVTEYYLGVPRRVLAGSALTDDRGQYVMPSVPAGRAYFLQAAKRARALDARADTPLDPKRRRPLPLAAYYPNSPLVDGAMAVTLRPGEQRTGVDFQMRRAPAYCLEAITTAAGVPTSMEFKLLRPDVTEGGMNYGGNFGFAETGMSPADGKIRLCNLHPGQYALQTVSGLKPPEYIPAYFALTPFTIADRDLRDFRITAMPPMSLSGEVAWADPEAAKPKDGTVNISMQGVTRARWAGEANSADTPAPGSFTIKTVVPDDYILRVDAHLLPDVYLKDVTYGGVSVKNAPLRPGSAPDGSGLRVVLARDGGAIAVQVADKDGNSVQGANLYLFPANARSDAALSAALVSGTADQNGSFRTPAPLAPGKYIVIATGTRLTYSAEHIAALWKGRSRGTEVEIPAKGVVQAKVMPVELDIR